MLCGVTILMRFRSTATSIVPNRGGGGVKFALVPTEWVVLVLAPERGVHV